ncbi:hypothetical protein NEOLEDRAFT_1054362 [Neolentinus lepideus HHB14362 ss-1]|uniref:Ima1 N-terminal domain-containing protein n=1 Tax=Neolentinus lepideus HHB14362 ss-1 TaxID=1314782 RepID=A0A165W5X9_9AGAM|nr:hypothetical protein NEOLEDRAFT_1054362 [Neolentinus lepideus HHB14362 ss-1]
MAPLLRRPTSATCFFCNTAVTPLPQNPRNFRCPRCQCWNRYDVSGEIMSDEPAMHDEALNVRSFSKRASPSKERFPSTYTKTPFCHTCTTNQMLLTNLLANYLPPTTSPEYDRRIQLLPEYKASLYARYPPVCAACAPAVEEEIRNKEAMARTSALGVWLRESKGKGKGKQRQGSAAPEDVGRARRQLALWRMRGGLWVATLVSSLAGNLAGSLGHSIPPRLAAIQPALPVLAFSSLLWTAWDPTYRTVRKAERQGRSVKVQGKRHYNVLQMTAYLSRLLTCTLLAMPWYRPSWDYLHLHDSESSQSRIYFTIMLVIELITLVYSLAVLRLHHPAPIRLIDTNSHKRALTPQLHPDPAAPLTSTAPAPADTDLLASLTLSSKPVLPPPKPQQPHPVFGLPSLVAQPPRETRDDDAMDWSPTGPAAAKKRQDEEDGSWLRPQRFFPPEQPTGLESLFPRIQLVDDAAQVVRRRPRVAYWRWALVMAVAVVAVGVGVGWERVRHGATLVSGHSTRAQAQAEPMPAEYVDGDFK